MSYSDDCKLPSLSDKALNALQSASNSSKMKGMFQEIFHYNKLFYNQPATLGIFDAVMHDELPLFVGLELQLPDDETR